MGTRRAWFSGATAICAVALLAWPVGAQREESSRWLRNAQTYAGAAAVSGTVGARGAVLTLASGARLELPPRRTAVELRLSSASARTAPCRLAGFVQVGDTLRIAGPTRSAAHFTLFVPEGTPLRARAGHTLVLAAHRRSAAAAIGGAQTETIGSAQTRTVGGAQTDTVDNDETITIHGSRTEPGRAGRWSGDYYVTSVTHVAGPSPGLRATVRLDADIDALHVGWLPTGTR